MRAALLDFGAEQPSHVLLAIHPLACDQDSWRLLQEDLQTAYGQLSQGQSIELPAGITFRRWAQQLATHAESGMLESELDYWTNVVRAQTTRLPAEPEHAGSDVAMAPHTFTVTLSPEQTSALLHEIPSSHHADIEAVLLAPLAQALTSWAGAPALLLDLETHGRAGPPADLDLSRTLGCGAPLFPLLVRPDPASDPGSALRSLKEQLRSVPNGGAGYGMLRYLAGAGERLRALPQAQVYFTCQTPLHTAGTTTDEYVGGVILEGRPPQTPPFSPSELFESVQELDSPARSPHGRRYLLAISAGVAEGRLRVCWTYDQGRYRPATIAHLAERFVEAAQALIDHCRAEAGGFSPSDFPEAGLNQSQLDKIMTGIKRRAAQQTGVDTT